MRGSAPTSRRTFLRLATASGLAGSALGAAGPAFAQMATTVRTAELMAPTAARRLDGLGDRARHDENQSWPVRFVTPAGFIGCRGGQDDEAGDAWRRRRAVAAARPCARCGRDGLPDATCWL